MSWRTELYHVLGAYFCDSSLGEGAAELVFASEDDPAYQKRCLSALDKGIEIAHAGSREEKVELVALLRRANLAAATAEDAHGILAEIRDEYRKLLLQENTGTDNETGNTGCL